MALAYKCNSDLVFDTMVLKQAGKKYQDIASNLRRMSKELDNLLMGLKESGWTTPAGTAFHEMTQTNWEKNIEKYADLLDTLKDILDKAANDYDDLMADHVRTTKVHL